MSFAANFQNRFTLMVAVVVLLAALALGAWAVRQVAARRTTMAIALKFGIRRLSTIYLTDWIPAKEAIPLVAVPRESVTSPLRRGRERRTANRIQQGGGEHAPALRLY